MKVNIEIKEILGQTPPIFFPFVYTKNYQGKLMGWETELKAINEGVKKAYELGATSIQIRPLRRVK